MARVFLPTAQIAEDNTVCAETIRRLHRRGIIPGYKFGRYLRFDPDEVREALRSTPAAHTGVATGVGAGPNFDALDAE